MFNIFLLWYINKNVRNFFLVLPRNKASIGGHMIMPDLFKPDLNLL